MITPFSCPTCHGSGTVSKPPWIAGDQETWVANTAWNLYSCPSCNGSGVIWNEIARFVGNEV